MIRTQIQITPEQNRRLRARARREGVSLAEALRRCVEEAMGSQAAPLAAGYAKVLEVAGTFEDREGRRDVSSQHDEYLYGAKR